MCCALCRAADVLRGAVPTADVRRGARRERRRGRDPERPARTAIDLLPLPAAAAVLLLRGARRPQRDRRPLLSARLVRLGLLGGDLHAGRAGLRAGTTCAATRRVSLTVESSRVESESFSGS